MEFYVARGFWAVSAYIDLLVDQPKIMKEVMQIMHTSLLRDKRYEGVECRMSVTDLWDELLSNGEDIDGTKDMLIDRVRESRKGKVESRKRKQEISEAG